MSLRVPPLFQMGVDEVHELQQSVGRGRVYPEVARAAAESTAALPSAS
ncbi:hypothetical protein [Microtetraspora malaysiensis]|nr:hypothetical protein [Microtetraspora malaysiensis]